MGTNPEFPELYEDCHPDYPVPSTSRRKGPQIPGISIHESGPQWTKPDWRDAVAESAARTVLDRHIYRLIAARTIARTPLFAPEIEELILYGDATGWLVRMLSGRQGRRRVVAQRLAYLVRLGVIIHAQSRGALAKEHVGAREIHKQPRRPKTTPHLNNHAPDQAHNNPQQCPANDLRGPCGEVRAVGDSPGTVQGLLSPS